MTDETYISEGAAMSVLMRDGDFTPDQAKIVLGHSLKKDICGGVYHPMTYIYKRASDNAARPEA